MAVYIQLKQRRNAGSRQALRAGDYNYIKDYNVVDADGKIATAFCGWIIQLVQKRSEATVSNGRILRTTQDFLRFTDGNTTFMTHSYIERFRVENGIAVDGDQFASGGVTPYNGTDPDFITTPTTGTVNQVGTNILVSDVDAAFFADLDWDFIPGHPANGLEVIEDTRDWPALVARNCSANKPIHSLNATWISAGDTQLTIHFINNGPRGPPGGVPRDGVATAERVAYCVGLEREALMPGFTFHGVSLVRGGWYANMCTIATCVVVGLGTIYTFMPKGGKKQTRKVRRLRK